MTLEELKKAWRETVVEWGPLYWPPLHPQTGLKLLEMIEVLRGGLKYYEGAFNCNVADRTLVDAAEIERSL